MRPRLQTSTSGSRFLSVKTSSDGPWGVCPRWPVCLGLLITALFCAAGCGGSTKKEKSLDTQISEAMKLSDDSARARKLIAIAEKQHKGEDALGAQSTLRAATEAANAVKDPSSRASALNLLAATFGKLNQADEAKTQLAAAAKAIDEIKDADAKVSPLADLATQTATILKDPQQAAGYLKKAETAIEAITNTQVKLRSYAAVAAAYLKLKQADEAQKVTTKVLEYARSRTDAREKADSLTEAAALLHRLEKTAERDAAFEESQKAAGEITAGDSKAYALLHLGLKLKESGRKDLAKSVLAKADEIASKIKDTGIRNPLVQEIANAQGGL